MAALPPRSSRRRPRRGSLERPVSGRLYRGTWLLVGIPLLAAAFSVHKPGPLPPPTTVLPASFDGPSAGDGRGKRQFTGIVHGGQRMPAEPREDAAAGNRVAVRDKLADSRPGGQEEPFACAPADHRGEEGHLPLAVDRRDDRQRLDAEPIERPPVRRGLPGDGNTPDARGICAERSVDHQCDEERGGGRKAGSAHVVRL